MLVGAALFGSGFYERADPFEVYSSLVAKLSIWGRRDGELVIRSPLANLDTVTRQPGLLAVVAVLFGSTAFDSFQDSSPWLRFIQSRLGSAYLLDHLALVGFCVGVGVIFAVGAAATGVGPDQPRWTLPDVFAHDRAVKVLPARHQVTGQLPLLAAMVAFTVGGLYLLFAS